MITNRRESIEPKKMYALKELGEKILEQVERETNERISNNPNPTDEEMMIGAFREMLEPQIRDAVFEFNRKGYSTESSGFGGEGQIQALDGYFEIDEETMKKLEAMGVQVLKGKDVGMPFQSDRYTFIQFKPDTININDIKTKWDQIASLLPVKEGASSPSISGGSEDFRNQYASQRTDIEKRMIEKRLALVEHHPDVIAKMKKD